MGCETLFYLIVHFAVPPFCVIFHAHTMDAHKSAKHPKKWIANLVSLLTCSGATGHLQV